MPFSVLAGFLQHPSDQIDGLPLQLLSKVLVSPQLAALMPGQQADDIVLNPGTGQGRSREVA